MLVSTLQEMKGRKGVEVAECCSGNKLSSQKPLENSVLFPSAFLVCHKRTPLTTQLLQKITQHLLQIWA